MADSVNRMRSHIETLLIEHDINLHPTAMRPINAWARPGKRLVALPVIKSELSYAVALHEIGHILTDQRYPSNLTREMDWARQHALGWTPRMDREAINGIVHGARLDGECCRAPG